MYQKSRPSFILVKTLGKTESFFHPDGFTLSRSKAKVFPHLCDAHKAACAINSPNVRVRQEKK